jgi:hypothetical protein
MRSYSLFISLGASARKNIYVASARESAIIWPDAFEVPLVAYALYK